MIRGIIILLNIASLILVIYYLKKWGVRSNRTKLTIHSNKNCKKSPI